MKKIKNIRGKIEYQQVVGFSHAKLFVKKHTHTQMIPEVKFCKYLKLIK